MSINTKCINYKIISGEIRQRSSSFDLFQKIETEKGNNLYKADYFLFKLHQNVNRMKNCKPQKSWLCTELCS